MITDDQLKDYAADPRAIRGKMAAELIRLREIEAVLILADFDVNRIKTVAFDAAVKLVKTTEAQPTPSDAATEAQS